MQVVSTAVLNVQRADGMSNQRNLLCTVVAGSDEEGWEGAGDPGK